MSFRIRDKKKGRVVSLNILPVFAIGFFLILALVFAIPIIVLNRTAKLVGAMYRTEANLTAIESAIKIYTERYGDLPPSGHRGLELAVEEMNRHVAFMPDGVPKDEWGADYVYVNSKDYEKQNSLAIRDGGSGLYHNPGGYQLYSLGTDGKRSPEDGIIAGDRLNDDNINNWDRKQSWRDVYERRSQPMDSAKNL